MLGSMSFDKGKELSGSLGVFSFKEFEIAKDVYQVDFAGQVLAEGQNVLEFLLHLPDVHGVLVLLLNHSSGSRVLLIFFLLFCFELGEKRLVHSLLSSQMFCLEDSELSHGCVTDLHDFLAVLGVNLGLDIVPVFLIGLVIFWLEING